MSKKYRSDGMAAIHEAIEALHANQKAIRERERVSQTVFANYLNVTTSLVSKWERGEKRPSGPTLKLLSLVEKHGISAVA